MIEAVWVGGPYDGDRWALEDIAPFDMPVIDEADPLAPGVRFRYRTFRPELTANGWVLRWREP